MSVSDNLLTGKIYEVPVVATTASSGIQGTRYPVFLVPLVFDGDELADYTGTIVDNNGNEYPFGSENLEVVLDGFGLTSFTVTATKDGETIVNETFTVNLTYKAHLDSAFINNANFKLNSKSFNPISQAAKVLVDVQNPVYAVHDFERVYTSNSNNPELYYKTQNRAEMYDLTVEPTYPYSKEQVTKSEIEGAISEVGTKAYLALGTAMKESLEFTSSNYNSFYIDFLDNTAFVHFDTYGGFVIPTSKINTGEDVELWIVKSGEEFDIPVLKITLKGGIKLEVPSVTDTDVSIASADGTVAYSDMSSGVASSVNLKQTVDTVTVKKRSQTTSKINEYFASPVAATVDGYLGVNVPITSGTYDLTVGTTIYTKSLVQGQGRINNVGGGLNVTVSDGNLAIAIPIPSGITAEDVSAIGLFVGATEAGVGGEFTQSLAVAIPCVLQTAVI